MDALIRCAHAITRRVPPRYAAAIAVLSLAWVSQVLGSQYVRNGPPTEHQVKAAYLLNFTRFAEWPASSTGDSSAPFAICIAGHDPFGTDLDRIVDGETAAGRRIVVRRLAQQQADGCQVLYVGKGETAHQQGVLTVGEGEEFVRTGGIIGFVVENRRVRFDISQRAAQRAGITLSSKLLSVARSVEK